MFLYLPNILETMRTDVTIVTQAWAFNALRPSQDVVDEWSKLLNLFMPFLTGLLDFENFGIGLKFVHHKVDGQDVQSLGKEE